MPYTVEIFNRFNQLVEASRNAVCRHIQYLLKPDDGYPKGSDVKLKELYNVWRADCRAMDAACEEYIHLASRQEMIVMPPDDEEHTLCRRMAAVIIERNIFSEFNAENYLPALVEKMKVSECWKHPDSCTCHDLKGWTYKNNDLLHTLNMHYVEKEGDRLRLAEPVSVGGGALSHQPAMGGGSRVRVACGGWRDCTCGGCSGGGAGAAPLSSPSLRHTRPHLTDCACGVCHRARVANGTQDAYMARLTAETDRVLAREFQTDRYTSSASIDGMLGTAHPMHASRSGLDDDFVKNLFKAVQGVEYDSKCPHGLPFYACMPCSH
jgi:hypothetical protein